MKILENKVAIVTGAASGIGREIVLLFAAEGCHVIAVDINEDKLKRVDEELKLLNYNCHTLHLNVSKENDVDRIFHYTIHEFGKIDILVNNAGIMDNFEPVGDLDVPDWQFILEVNLTGPFLMMRRMISNNISRKKGTIVNISSIGGLNGGRAGAAYTASKHGLIGLTKNTGFLYAREGIRCNAIAPGAVNTDIASSINQSKTPAIYLNRIMEGFPLSKKAAEPNEIAQVALFLASDQSSYINGTTIVADDAWTAY